MHSRRNAGGTAQAARTNFKIMKKKQNEPVLNDNQTKLVESLFPQPQPNGITFSPAAIQEIDTILPQILRQLPWQIQDAIYYACMANLSEKMAENRTRGHHSKPPETDLMDLGVDDGRCPLCRLENKVASTDPEFIKKWQCSCWDPNSPNSIVVKKK